MITFAGVPDRSEEHLAAVRRLPIVPALVVGIVASLVVGLAAWVLFSWWWLGIVVGVGAGAMTYVLRPRHAVERVLACYSAEPMDPEASPRLDNLVEALCYSAGVDDPAELIKKSEQSFPLR